MSVELGVWIVVSLIGLLALPFVGRRRSLESRYHRMLGGNGVRGVILANRSWRAGILSLGVLLAALVAILTWLLEPSVVRRVVTIAMLIGIEVCMVATLILDEWFATRIDQAERREGRR